MHNFPLRPARRSSYRRHYFISPYEVWSCASRQASAETRTHNTHMQCHTTLLPTKIPDVCLLHARTCWRVCRITRVLHYQLRLNHHLDGHDDTLGDISKYIHRPTINQTRVTEIQCRISRRASTGDTAVARYLELVSPSYLSTQDNCHTRKIQVLEPK